MFVFRSVYRLGPVSATRRALSYSRPVWQDQAASQQNVTGQLEILTRLKADLKTAMKARNSSASTVIRSVLAEVTNLEKTKAGSPIGEGSVYAVIRKAVGKRVDAAEQFRAASRTDLADKEDEEVKLLNTFLPPPLTNDEVERFMAEAVSSVLTSSPGAQVGSPGAKGSVNPNALVGKSLKAFWANVPSGNAGSIPNEEVTKRLKVLIEERLQ